ncbi:hypothetical protein AB0C07_21955 [Actinoplanes missouriensis]|uniref:hypothetical protein n=1 Tax=Actinoplanes missouriensis TaxID=1866 RepID=UPI0033D89E04
MSSLSHRALVTLTVAGIAALVPSPASAHPFGDPQTVAITHDARHPDVVSVRWRVGGPDDLTVLGMSLDVIGKDRARPDGTVDYRYTDAGEVGSSAAFTRYLLDRITVTTGAAPCSGTVQPIRALALKGATVDFACPAPVETATVAVRMLTDLNPAYRTLATGPSGQRTVYEKGHDSHDWTLVGDPPGGGSALLQIGAVLGGLVALLLVVLLARRAAA